MNIAILIGRFPPGVVGGAELQAEAWAARLAARHRVTVITRRVPSDRPESITRDGFEVRAMNVSPVPIWRTVADLWGIERIVASLDPRPDLMLCFQTFVSGLAGVRIQRRLQIPAVVWVRGENELRIGTTDRSRWLSPRVWTDARGVLVQSASIRAALLERIRTIDRRVCERVAGKIDVVPNGLDLPAPPFEAGKGVLVVGRLIHDKGVDLAIRAAATAGLPITVAGDGPERASLEALSVRLGAAVHFEGMATRDRLLALYRAAAIVVLASRRGEGMPNVLLEAMAHARPVVATPVMGVADLVRDGVNGLLVPCDDPGALAETLSRVHADPALARRLGAAARISAESFGWDRTLPLLESVLERWRRA